MPVTEQQAKVQKGAGNLTGEGVDKNYARDAGRARDVNVSYWDFVTHLQTVGRIIKEDVVEWWRNRR